MSRLSSLVILLAILITFLYALWNLGIGTLKLVIDKTTASVHTFVSQASNQYQTRLQTTNEL